MAHLEGENVYEGKICPDRARRLLHQAVLGAVPPGRLQRGPVGVDAILRPRLERGGIYPDHLLLLVDHTDAQHIELELQIVDGLLMLPGVGLEDGRDESVRKEEAREPVGAWVALQHPGPDEIGSLLQVLEPACQLRHGSIGDLRPVRGHFVAEKALIHLV